MNIEERARDSKIQDVVRERAAKSDLLGALLRLIWPSATTPPKRPPQPSSLEHEVARAEGEGMPPPPAEQDVKA
jgi:hypothetical protein